MKEGRKWLFYDAFNTFYLQLYGVGHMVKEHSDSERWNLLPHFMGYSFLLAAKGLLYVPSHIQNSTYHNLCYTSCGALAGTRNWLMGPPWGIDPAAHCILSRYFTMELHLCPVWYKSDSIAQWYKTNLQQFLTIIWCHL